MNGILESLCFGNGRIDETQVTGLLSYILDPLCDHGYGASVLSRLLERFDNSLHDVLFDPSHDPKCDQITVTPEYSLLSQDFESKTDIIDVLIEFRSGDSDLKAILGIEVKTQKGAESKSTLDGEFSQVLRQVEKLVQRRERLTSKYAVVPVCHIYLVPLSLKRSSTAYQYCAEHLERRAYEEVCSVIVPWQDEAEDSFQSVLQSVPSDSADDKRLLNEFNHMIANDFYRDAGAIRRMRRIAPIVMEYLNDKLPQITWAPSQGRSLKIRIAGRNDAPIVFTPNASGGKISLYSTHKDIPELVRSLNSSFRKYFSGENLVEAKSGGVTGKLNLRLNDISIESILGYELFRDQLAILVADSVSACEANDYEAQLEARLAAHGDAFLEDGYRNVRYLIDQSDVLGVFIRKEKWRFRIFSDFLDRIISTAEFRTQLRVIDFPLPIELDSYTDEERALLHPDARQLNNGKSTVRLTVEELTDGTQGQPNEVVTVLVQLLEDVARDER